MRSDGGGLGPVPRPIVPVGALRWLVLAGSVILVIAGLLGMHAVAGGHAVSPVNVGAASVAHLYSEIVAGHGAQGHTAFGDASTTRPISSEHGTQPDIASCGSCAAHDPSGEMVMLCGMLLLSALALMVFRMPGAALSLSSRQDATPCPTRNPSAHLRPSLLALSISRT